MQRCLVLAQKGLGHVSPNPMVGCVIVYEDRIIAEGYHKQYGGPHAEVNAINALDDHSILSKCTVYVSLEPCAHHGKTPPCANLLADKKVGHVVIGTTDPYPEVAGKGIGILRNAGIPVTLGILEDACKAVNKRFFINQIKKRPYVILKWAESADAFIGGNERMTISGEDALKMVHQWRAEEDAFLVGTNTLLIDNPKLNTRFVNGRDPIRIAIDFDLKSDNIDLEFKSGKQRTIILNGKLEATVGNIEYVKIPDRNVSTILNVLWQQRIGSVVVEGGGKLLESFIKDGLYDEIRRFRSNKVTLGKGVMAPKYERTPTETIALGQDTLNIFR